MRDHQGEPTISQRLAAWGQGLEFRDLPESTRAKARDILVDIVGLCVAARHTDYVAATFRAIEPGRHTVIGRKATASASGAALANGTAAHGEDFDDTFEGGPVHSGVVIVPALLAAAETFDLPSDRTMTGIVAGTELLCRLALTLPKGVHKAGFHPTAVLGTFAATFGICVAMRESEEVTANALGIAGSMASGIIEYLGDGSWTKRMHPGWSAQSALRAHALARGGFIGPRAVFEGTHGAFSAFAPSIEPRTHRLFLGLGKEFVSDNITFKPYPCGTMVQPYIDCAVALRRRGVELEGIRSITCKTAEGIVHRLWEPLDIKRRPPSSYAAKFSVPFGVALGLQRGRAGLNDFTNETIADPELCALAQKVGFEIDPENPYPAAFTGHVRIEYRDGRLEEVERDHMRGGAAEPLTRTEIDGKFLANTAFGGSESGEALLALCHRIGAGQGGADLITGLGEA
ncbi:MmgE/PrpD family protein [Falsirhodobacter sp. 20TX0035]|uniref:MmgE/PrpD family protein n=1 Tax=Falsirhodobacter sp. 20TX0035 TaxID=3022019 RepID=UPI00232ED976|nr:MmgE/PrpD family protein [Falsirhodobacter sp. 20TX0035]MDB6455087.1 MmgE/PrpD family protein [Falsirhodobacter sp. 20TX0035]